MHRDQISGMKILVTGASGYIGPHLCRRLCSSCADVHAVSRSARSIGGEGFHLWFGDLTEISTVRGIFSAVQPDLIYHLSGHAAGGRELQLVLPTLHSNLITTVNVLTVAAEAGCGRIILAGSLEEPDPQNPESVPSSPYAASKWASSAYARMFYRLYNTPVVNLRIFMTYGPGRQDNQKLVPYVISSLLKGESPKLGSGRRNIDWVYIDDVVDALIAAAYAPNVEGRTIDVGSGAVLSIHAVVQRLVHILNSQVTPQFSTVPDRPLEQVRTANIENTYRVLGWKPKTSIEEGLKNTVEWYREQLKKSDGPAPLYNA